MGGTIRDLIVALSVDSLGVGDGLDKGINEFKQSEGKFKAVASGIGLAIGGVLTASFLENLDIEQANAKLTGQLGVTKDESARLGKIAGELYAQNFGDSIEDVDTALENVIQNIDGMRTATTKDLEDISGSVINVAQTFDKDFGEVTRAVGKMLKTGVADNAKEALDILVYGFQTGADASGDLLDSFNEYSTQFRKLGLDGQQALGLIESGLQGGARDADMVSDAIKEFAIRAVDGSSTTAAGFDAVNKALEAAGQGTYNFAQDIAKGGDSARESLSSVIFGLSQIADPIERNAAATALFGTKAEDLGDALYQLDPHVANVNGNLKDLVGSTDRLNKVVGDTAKSKIETLKRSFEVWVNSMVQSQGTVGTVATALAAFGAPALSAAADVAQIANGFAGLAKTAISVGGAVVGKVADVAASFASLAVQAAAGLGKALVAFGSLAVEAAASSAKAVAAIGLQIAQWVILGTQSLLQAARVALAWVIAMGPIGIIIAAVIALVALIIANWDKIKNAIGVAWEWVKEKTKAVWDWIVNAIKTAIDFITRFFLPFAIVRLIAENWDKIKEGAKIAWNFVVAVIKKAIDNVLEVIGFIASIPGKVAGWFKEMGELAIKRVLEFVEWLKSLPGRIIDSISSVNQRIFELGRNLVVGLWNGIINMAQWLYDKIVGFFGSIVDWVKHTLGIASPSKVFANIGKMSMLGLTMGIDQFGDQAVDATNNVVSKMASAFATPLNANVNGQWSGGYVMPSGNYGVTPEGGGSPGGITVGNITLQFADDRDMYQKGRDFAAGLREYKRLGGVLPS